MAHGRAQRVAPHEGEVANEQPRRVGLAAGAKAADDAQAALAAEDEQRGLCVAVVDAVKYKVRSAAALNEARRALEREELLLRVHNAGGRNASERAPQGLHLGRADVLARSRGVAVQRRERHVVEIDDAQAAHAAAAQRHGRVRADAADANHNDVRALHAARVSLGAEEGRRARELLGAQLRRVAQARLRRRGRRRRQ